tara:strand:- start:119 stop:334 length:216 start_codon:yes stop_codon:yes gene_type:complete
VFNGASGLLAPRSLRFFLEELDEGDEAGDKEDVTEGEDVEAEEDADEARDGDADGDGEEDEVSSLVCCRSC